MNRNRRLTVLLLATLALLMLAGCSVLDPLLHPDHEVTGNPDERDTRFVEGSAYHGKDPETRVEPVTDENGEPVTDENGEIVTAVVPVGTETATGEAETQDPYRDLTEQERSDLQSLYNQVIRSGGLLLVGGWGTPNGALRDSTDGQTGNAFGAAFDSLKDAGFNCVVTADEWKSPEALAASLSAARSRQMKLWYNCGGQDSDNTVAKLRDLLKSRDSDALGAIVVTIPDSTDDPSAVDLPDFIQYVDNLRTGLNTDKLKMTVRLLPSYANFKGTESYDLTYGQYVQDYMKGQGLDYTLFAYDSFPSDGTNRLAGLIGCMKAAKFGARPVYPVLQCAGSDTLREPTLEELRLSVHISLAMGAKGYFFNGICGRPDSTDTGILDANGNRTNLYNRVKAVNAEIAGMREIFLSSNHISTSVFNFPDAAAELGITSDSFYGALTAVSEAHDGAILVGNFSDRNNRYSYYVVNADPTQNASVTLTFNERRLVVTWGDNGCEYVNRTDTVTLNLKPGEGMYVFTSSLVNE